MIVIPAIDIIKGKCVRLTQGKYDQMTEYQASPLEVALQYEKLGFTRLHLIDLDGARSSQIQNLNILKEIASNTSLKIDFGGGLKRITDLHDAIEAGAFQLNIGSIAVENPILFQQWLKRYTPEKLILSVDAKNGQILSRAWEASSNYTIKDFINNFIDDKLKYIAVTDTSVDGTLQGPNFKLYELLQRDFPQLKIIASGGVGSIKDIELLKDIGVYGCIVGKAIYEKKIDPLDLIKYAK